MIDTDKMKAAFAATPLCQAQWTLKDDNGGPTKLCAISSLVSFAGVQPDLIQKMQEVSVEAPAVWKQVGISEVVPIPEWVHTLALPVLRAVYGIPQDVAARFPSLFDQQENEWKGVTAVLGLCERHNYGEMRAEAIEEDRQRFPQLGPLPLFFGNIALSGEFTSVWHTEMHTAPLVKPKGDTKTGQSLFWSPKTPKWLGNPLALSK